MFPQAKIIHCRRNPLDTALSIYFQDFANGHKYAYDFTHIINYYQDYLRLMGHWHRISGLEILDIQYEQLVSEPETVTRAILEHLSLEWDERCLEFHHSQRVVNTASNEQVREPIYTRSVQHWKKYRFALDGLPELPAEFKAEPNG